MPRKTLIVISSPNGNEFTYARTTTRENAAAWQYLLKINMAHQALCELNEIKDFFREKPVSVESASRGAIPAAQLFAMARASIFSNQPKTDRRHIGNGVRCSTWRQRWDETCDLIEDLGLNAL